MRTSSSSLRDWRTPRAEAPTAGRRLDSRAWQYAQSNIAQLHHTLP